MVSALWTAASENDIENLRNLLQNASVADIEIADETGATPLIQAVKAGHVDAVSVLLERGADPYHGSAEGRPDQFTQDPAILNLLCDAEARFGGSHQMIPPMPHAPPEGVYDPNMQFWGPPPPGMYPYYPGPMGAPQHPAGSPNGSMSPPPPMPFYAPPPMAMGPGNLPPADVARMIPCRFYPACRYGATCMFAHPQTQGPPPANGAFYPPGPPAGPYGPYDPSQFQHGYGPSFYPPPPGPGYPPANGPNGIPISPPPVMDPSSPLSGPSPPMMHSGPISPVQAGFPPMAIAPGPAQMHGLNGAYPIPPPPQSFSTNPGSPNTSFPPPTTILPFDPQPNDQIQTQHPPNGPGHQRRGSARKSFSIAGTNSRKPPCAYFPVGRCRNGDMCRFPHVMPTDPVVNGPHLGTQSRGPPRPRHGGVHANGFPPLDEKMAQMSLHNGSSPRGSMNGNGGPPRAPRAMNGPPPLKQRLPGADEFPTLGGSSTPPAHVSTPATPTALTAAQVLQAPAPARNGSSSKAPWANGKSQSASASVSGSGPSVNGSVNGDTSDADVKAEAPAAAVNGHIDGHVQKPIIPVKLPNGADVETKADAPAPMINGNGHALALKPVIPVKLPLSFAAAANSAVATTPELSVSA